MTPHIPHFVVVAGLDNSPASESVLATGIAYLRGRQNAALHLVHVLDLEVGRDLPGFVPLLEEARRYLDRMRKQATDTYGADVTTHLGVGRPWREIVQTATNTQADVIVVGTHGRAGISRLVMGSQAELVVRKASCPVLVVRKKDYASHEVPEIEPPCPDCLREQDESAGLRLWCERHATHHPAPHRHYEFPQSFAVGDMLIRPD